MGIMIGVLLLRMPSSSRGGWMGWDGMQWGDGGEGEGVDVHTLLCLLYVVHNFIRGC